MGRFDFYPRFYRRTDGFRTREQKRKEQNEERGGSPLAFTPVAPARAVADYHSCRSSWRDHLHMQKIGFAEALDSIVATDNRYSPEAYVFLRDVLYYTTKQQKKTNSTAGQPGSPKANSGLHCVPFFHRGLVPPVDLNTNARLQQRERLKAQNETADSRAACFKKIEPAICRPFELRLLKCRSR